MPPGDAECVTGVLELLGEPEDAGPEDIIGPLLTSDMDPEDTVGSPTETVLTSDMDPEETVGSLTEKVLKSDTDPEDTVGSLATTVLALDNVVGFVPTGGRLVPVVVVQSIVAGVVTVVPTVTAPVDTPKSELPASLKVDAPPAAEILPVLPDVGAEKVDAPPLAELDEPPPPDDADGLVMVPTITMSFPSCLSFV